MRSHVLETRSTKPGTAEPRLVIEHREALIYMICEAAELEHGLMCEYLFAAFSLKNHVGEGVSEDRLQAIQHWRSTVLGVAAQEMLHLALTANMLTALGASPHLSRPQRLRLPGTAGRTCRLLRLRSDLPSSRPGATSRPAEPRDGGRERSTG